MTEYTIYSEKISDSVRMVVLTDLHSCVYGDLQSELIEKIEEQNPDVILMSGDIMDDVMPDKNVIELLEGVANKYPCYYVTGNHEFWSGRVNEQKKIFRSYGVTVLEGDGEELTINGQRLLICGIDDPEVGTEVFDEQLSQVSELLSTESYSILLSHRPERFKRYAEKDFDLVISGHAHGGQWRIPLLLPNGLFAPNQGWFPTYTNGIHENCDTKMIVSRGLSRESTKIPRIFNAPELVVVEVSPNPKV